MGMKRCEQACFKKEISNTNTKYLYFIYMFSLMHLSFSLYCMKD